MDIVALPNVPLKTPAEPPGLAVSDIWVVAFVVGSDETIAAT